MKPNIHPKYTTSKVTCACGNTFQTRSTAGDLQVDICSSCHPFYTGKQKLVDSGGRVDRFERRLKKKAAAPAKPKAPKVRPPKPERPRPQPAAVAAETAPAEAAEAATSDES